MAVLEGGGNAVDAAVAAGFVLQVVEPQSCGLGGDLCALVHSAASGATSVICGQGPMPHTATLEAFEMLGLSAIPGSGMLPACVPGAFGGWLRMLLEFGTVSLDRALDAAISYAWSGFPLPADAAKAIDVLAPLFREEWPGSGETFLDRGDPPPAGAIVRNRVLAETMRRLLRESTTTADREAGIERALSAFYAGFVADRVDAFVRTSNVLDATGERHRGFLTGDDMASWVATIEAPARFTRGQYDVLKPGIWTQGPVFLQQLSLLDGRDLNSMGLLSGEYIHTLVEAIKLSTADREAWYGDSSSRVLTADDLLEIDYCRSRAALIGQTALREPPAGSPHGEQPWIVNPAPPPSLSGEPGWMQQLQAGIPTVVIQATLKAGDTSTVCVADRWGNLVAAVPSGGWLKSSPVIPGLGFALGTRGQAMWLASGHPNSLEPGRRPRTTLSPTVVLRDGEPFLAFGTPGGDRQDQWTMESFLGITEFGLNLQTATEITMFCSDHFPSSFSPRGSRPGVVSIEATCSEDALAELRKRGHEVETVAAKSMGKVCIVGRDEPRGSVRAGSGPRGLQAYAVCR